MDVIMRVPGLPPMQDSLEEHKNKCGERANLAAHHAFSCLQASHVTAQSFLSRQRQALLTLAGPHRCWLLETSSQEEDSRISMRSTRLI